MVGKDTHAEPQAHRCNRSRRHRRCRDSQSCHHGHRRHRLGHTPDGQRRQWRELNPLNNSGVVGQARIRVEGRQLHVRYDARRLARGLPNAAHIHYGEEARHECPTVRDDANGDFRVNVVERLAKYGGIVKSLTTSGGTSPDDARGHTLPHCPQGQGPLPPGHEDLARSGSRHPPG